ncbi:sirohydrochlorin chelatase [Candidatus Zixiibacteriota bacterium]
MVILVAHGSRRVNWRESVEGLLRSVQDVIGEGAVRLAWMDHGPPSMMDVLAEAVEEGQTIFRILPLFLAGSGHVTRDIAPMVDEARDRFDTIEVELLPAVGEHPQFRDLLLEIIGTPVSDHTEDRGSGNRP